MGYVVHFVKAGRTEVFRVSDSAPSLKSELPMQNPAALFSSAFLGRGPLQAATPALCSTTQTARQPACRATRGRAAAPRARGPRRAGHGRHGDWFRRQRVTAAVVVEGRPCSSPSAPPRRLPGIRRAALPDLEFYQTRDVSVKYRICNFHLNPYFGLQLLIAIQTRGIYVKYMILNLKNTPGSDRDYESRSDLGVFM
jgi:hypothetical protein